MSDIITLQKPEKIRLEIQLGKILKVGERTKAVLNPYAFISLFTQGKLRVLNTRTFKKNENFLVKQKCMLREHLYFYDIDIKIEKAQLGKFS